MATNMLPPQYQQWRPTTTCYLHNASSIAANNDVLPPQYHQCGGQQPRVTTSSDGQQPRVTSTIPVVWRPTTTCFLHSTSSVAANMLPPQYQQWRPTTTCYLHSANSVAANNHMLPPQCQ
ncbi:hypothetical protein Hamer_G007992 [Homarus americanus]|uniref:Uncharacterized protein n=1 Tax=Homarus americanus TaxID=6706 RepID=A0A8J5JWF2_HOMAM|nr:hypothetical protein Hamer_G007992 [Homarus americanus]